MKLVAYALVRRRIIFVTTFHNLISICSCILLLTTAFDCDYPVFILHFTNYSLVRQCSVVDSSTTTTSNEQVFKNVIDTVVSPNYPGQYGNNENRIYRIIAPTRSEILLVFNHFELEHEYKCAFDFLEASTSVCIKQVRFLSGHHSQRRRGKHK